MNILLVDDEILAIQYITSLLDWEHHGYQISSVAHSVAEAKQALESQDINVVIFDVYMPEENGVALSSFIASHYPNIGMIALSSFDTYDYVREILKNGAYDYILKHRVSKEILLSALVALERSIIQNTMIPQAKTYTYGNNEPRKDETMPQLALSLEQQKRILMAIDRNDLEEIQQNLQILYDGPAMSSTTSRLMVSKEILDFLGMYATKHSLSFPYEQSITEVVHILEQDDKDALIACIVSHFRSLLEGQIHNSLSLPVQKALHYIEHFYYRNISLEKCAKSIGVNASYLSRIVHQETGITFSKQLSLCRIKMAKVKILQGSSLKQIASECGFKNYNYFFKVFKDLEGVTPLGFMDKAVGKKN
ncbi:MAG TPA: response regulator [Sphaerochaeta sp.]|nr:response regulator [Sphaerochaeta sp.]